MKTESDTQGHRLSVSLARDPCRGIVQGPDSKGNYSVQDASNGKLYYFNNVCEHNPHRGIGSICVEHAQTLDGTLLWWILDDDGEVMHQNSTKLENVGPILKTGRSVIFYPFSVMELYRDDTHTVLVQSCNGHGTHTCTVDVDFISDDSPYAGLAFGVTSVPVL